MKTLLTLIASLTLASAQSISVTSPTANQTISGTSFTLTSSLVLLPSVASVDYVVNGERQCVVLKAPWSCNWNPYYVVNSPYNSIVAVARDSNGTVLATSTAVTPFTVANVLPETVAQLSWTVGTSTGIGSTWSSTVTFTFTLSGTNSATHCTNGANSCNVQIFVDGRLVQTLFGIVGSGTYGLDTTKFENGVRTVVTNLMDNTNPTGGTGGAWDQVAQWEQQITFSNGATAMEIRSNAREVFLCPTIQLLCPSSFTLTATQVNTDGTTQAASSPSYSSDTPSVATVGASSGVINAVGVGNAQITITSGGLSRIIWVFVNTQNVLPHFGSDGSILTGYDPIKSTFLAGVFQSNIGLTDNTYPPWAIFQQDFVNGGFNTIELGMANTPSGGQSESSFDSQQTSYVSGQVASLLPYGLFAGLIGDGLTRGNQQMYNITRSTGSAYVTPAVQYAVNSWKNNRAVYAVMQDEVQATNGGSPLIGTAQIGTNGLSQIVCINSANCTITWTNIQNNFPFATLCGGGVGFIITGSGNTNLDFNTSSGAPRPYVATYTGANTATFPTPTGVGTTTFTAGSNPNLKIEPLAESGYDSSTSCSGFPCPGQPCGSSAGPLVDYVRGNAFGTFMGWANNVAGRVKMTWPPDQGASATAVQNWMGDSRMSDFANIYTTSQNGQYLAQYFHLSDMLAAVGDSVRSKYASVQRLAPVMLNPSGSNVTWGVQGITVGVTSMTNDVITLSSPYTFPGAVIPGDTRLSMTGSTNSAFNTQFYVRYAIDSTHIKVVYNNPTSNPGNGAGGTITFEDGTVYGTGGLGPVMDGLTSGSPGNIETNNATPHSFINHRGQTFTVSGNALSYFNTHTFYYNLESNPNGFDQFNNKFREVPVGTSTGGTVVIVPNNNYTRGVTWSGPGGNEKGPRYPFANTMYNAVLRAAGTRTYYLGQQFDPGGSTAFTSTSLQDIQGGMHPRWDYGGAVFTWAANGLATKLIKRLSPYLLQPSLPSPDYGYYFECAAHSGTLGNMLGCQSLSDGTLTRTFNLSPFLVTGQTILRHYCTWSGCTVTVIAANTASDTVTMEPGAWVDYIFANNAAAEYTAPTITAQLTDVPNASSIVVQYAYLPYVLQWPSVQAIALPLTLNGTGTISLLVDKKIGTVYYRLVYLNGSNKVLATSDVQTL